MNLTAFKKAAPTKAKKEKPTLPDPTGEFSKLVTSAIEAKANVEANELVLDEAKRAIGNAALVHLFKVAQGQAEPEDTFQVLSLRGKALVSIKNSYKLPEDLGPVRALLGEHAATYLRDSVTISIDASAIPESVQQSFLDGLIRLARVTDLMLGVDGDGPVFNAITVKPSVVVDKAFHSDRHRLFTPAENVAIHQAMPCVVSMKLDY